MTSLMEKLMKLDRDKLLEIPTEKIKACHLSKVAGEEVEITVKALSGSRYTEIMSSATNKSGSVDMSRVYDTHAMVVIAGCVEPNLKDKELMEYYKAATPKDLVKILFPGGELVKISEKIGALSGFGKENDAGEGIEYDDIKNL
jgi:phage xkdN-like protein|nr:MAG TPA: tail assembly chaperone protein [Caudoviricetes sp.]